VSVIELARESDAAAIAEVYAPMVRDTAVSFELEPPSVAEIQRRIAEGVRRLPWLVCRLDERVAGYAYASSFRSRPAYRWTAETTVYVGPQWHRRGVGSAMYESLLGCIALLGYRTAIAVITLPNPASVRLHEKFGFRPAGVLHNVGYKFGRWHDTGWWELDLGATNRAFLKNTLFSSTPVRRSLMKTSGESDERSKVASPLVGGPAPGTSSDTTLNWYVHEPRAVADLANSPEWRETLRAGLRHLRPW
jgi:phosphinothricin acetyltransferase